MNRVIRKSVEIVYGLLGRPRYRARYDLANWLSRKHVRKTGHGLAYILPPKSVEGWILDAICREIDAFVGSPALTTHAYQYPLPIADAYFFSHYDYFRSALWNSEPEQGRSLVFFTHPKDLGVSREELCYVLSQCYRVVSMCGQSSQWLAELGVPSEKIEIATVGADPDFFPPHQRSEGAIGLCTAFYDRKNPERILHLVRAMPNRKFILLGRNWEQWERFGELQSLNNFQYEERPYSEYPFFYQEIDVFVSVSKLEGGPVPLVESMMSNVVPVVSRTGIGPDIIEDGVNGFLFDVNAPIAIIVELIERAYGSSTNIRKSVEHLTWERFSKQIQSIAGLIEPEENCDSHIRLEGKPASE